MMADTPTPIFILSLPRSGSTLTQSVIAAHARVATVSEPWLLLPFVYALRSPGVIAEYSHRSLVTAMEDFCAALPEGRADYEAEVREFALRLYARAMPRDTQPAATHFLDKTPRYCLIAEELLRIFPQAKFIFLWRNPLAILASMFGKDSKWRTYRYQVDLFKGMDNLIRTFEMNRDRVCAIQYEQLVTQPEATCRQMFDYLDLPFDPQVLADFKDVDLPGRMGDKEGTEAYDAVDTRSVDKWKSVLHNALRKRWAAGYLDWLGPDALKLMGYDMDTLRRELDQSPTSHQRLISDAARIVRFGWTGPEPRRVLVDR